MLLLSIAVATGTRHALSAPLYKHPGIIVSLKMLEKIRDDVRTKTEPVYTAYHAAKTLRVGVNDLWLANLSYAPQCQPLMQNGSGWVPWKEDAFAAYTHSLLWFIDRDPRRALRAIELLDGWTMQLMAQNTSWAINTWGLQTGWGAAVWPRAAEIIRHTSSLWSEEKAKAFGTMMEEKILPVVELGASTNGNIGHVMHEASFHIGIYNDNATTVANAVALWRGQAPAYLYLTHDGPTPIRPPAQPYLAHTWPTCGPTCDNAQIFEYWHGQKSFGPGRDGICQVSTHYLRFHPGALFPPMVLRKCRLPAKNNFVQEFAFRLENKE